MLCFAAATTAAFIILSELPFPILPAMILMGGIVTILETFSHPFDDNFSSCFLVVYHVSSIVPF